jgi:hypothetical protein
MRFIELVLNALTFALLDLLPDILHSFTQVDPSHHFDIVEVVDSANYQTVIVFLHVEKRFQLRLQLILSRVQSKRLELFAQNLLYQMIIAEEFSRNIEAGLFEIHDQDCQGKLLPPAPVESFTEVSVLGFDVNPHI